MSSSSTRCALLVVTIALIWPPLSAQDSARFTVDDMLDVVNVSAPALSRDGRWLVVMESTTRDRLGVDSHRYGDPSYISPGAARVWITNTATNERVPLFPDKQQVTAFQWSPDGERLVFFKRAENEFEAWIWDRPGSAFSRIRLPDRHTVDSTVAPRWTPDGASVYIAAHEADWAEETGERFGQLTRAPIVELSSEKPFLAWEQLRRMALSRSLFLYDPASGESRPIIADEKLLGYRRTEDGRFVIVTDDQTDKTSYDTIFGTESRIRAVPLDGGEPRVLRENVDGSSRGPRIVWSRHNSHYAWAEKEKIFFASIDDDEATRLTGEEDKKESDEAPAGDAAGTDDEKEKPEVFTPSSLSPDGRLLVATSKLGLWLIDTSDGSRTHLVEKEEDDDLAPAYSVLDWGPGALYLSFASRTEWDRSFVRYDLESGEMRHLNRGNDLLRGFQLSDDGSTVVYQSAGGNQPYEVHVADVAFSRTRRLTDANPSLAGRLGRSELITYLDVDGKTTHGVLYYPLDYQEGQRVPTVFNVYESYFDNAYNGTIAVLNARGYAVVRPSVHLERGYPGEAWVKGVTAAANRVIEMGVADPDRLGVHGTSYGGYATNLLITQTNRFKAAINISGKVNMVSFYTDSPRLGVRNIHAPENSQDRIGATLWEQPQKYIAHSAIMFTDRIKTPLLLITGEQDHNVPARQAMEMYYALRRLGRTVDWVSYTNGGHGMPRTNAEEVHDYHKRILGWYDKYLKANDTVPNQSPDFPSPGQPGR